MSAAALCPTCRQPIGLHRNGTFETHPRRVADENGPELCDGSGAAFTAEAAESLNDSTNSRRRRRLRIAMAPRVSRSPVCPNCLASLGFNISMSVAFVAPTRFYEDDRSVEKANIERAWKETYGAPESVAVAISDEAMLLYGVSATPTFVFVDREGVVTAYLPYRMTEERLSSAIDQLLR